MYVIIYVYTSILIVVTYYVCVCIVSEAWLKEWKFNCENSVLKFKAYSSYKSMNPFPPNVYICYRIVKILI